MAASFGMQDAFWVLGWMTVLQRLWLTLPRLLPRALEQAGKGAGEASSPSRQSQRLPSGSARVRCAPVVPEPCTACRRPPTGGYVCDPAVLTQPGSHRTPVPSPWPYRPRASGLRVPAGAGSSSFVSFQVHYRKICAVCQGEAPRLLLRGDYTGMFAFTASICSAWSRLCTYTNAAHSLQFRSPKNGCSAVASAGPSGIVAAAARTSS